MRARYSEYFLNHVLLLQDELATYYVQDRFSVDNDFLGVELKTFFDHREAVEWLKDCVSYDNGGIRNLRYFLDESAPHSYELCRWDDYQVMDEAALVIMDYDYPVVIMPLFEPPELESEIFDVICALRDGAPLSVAAGSDGSLLQAAKILNLAADVHMKFAGSDWDKGQAALKNVNPFMANTVPGSWKMPEGRQNQFAHQVLQRMEAGLIPTLKHSGKGWSDPSAALKVIINALIIILNISIDSFQKALRHPIDFFVLEPIKEFSSIFKVPEPNPNGDKSDLDIMGKYKLNYDIHPDDLDSADHPRRVDEWMRKKRNQLDSTSALKGVSWPTPEQAEQILAVVIMIYVTKKVSTYIKPKVANSGAYQKAKGAVQKVTGKKPASPGVSPVKNPPSTAKADNAANNASGKTGHSPVANKPKADKKVANKKDVNNNSGPKKATETEWKRNKLPEKTADELYEDIRNSKTDVANIAKHYNLKPERLEKIKDYVFDNPKFTPHKPTAEAWQRLSNGIGTEHDKLLLKHETAEMFYNDWIKKNPQKYLDRYEPLTSHEISNYKGYDWESGVPTE